MVLESLADLLCSTCSQHVRQTLTHHRTALAVSHSLHKQD